VEGRCPVGLGHPLSYGDQGGDLKRFLAALAIPIVVLAAAGCGGGGDQGSVGSSTTTTTSAASTQRKGQAGASDGQTGAKDNSPSSQHSAPSPPPTSFTTDELSPTQSSQLASKGSTTILVRVGGPGEVSVFGQAQLDNGNERVAATSPKLVSAPGLVRLSVRLTPAARAWLADGKEMTVHFAVYFSKAVTGQRLVAHLEG
jgi:hypothetical protein